MLATEKHQHSKIKWNLTRYTFWKIDCDIFQEKGCEGMAKLETTSMLTLWLSNRAYIQDGSQLEGKDIFTWNQEPRKYTVKTSINMAFHFPSDVPEDDLKNEK